jgi:multidrug resistance protein, MATE family
MSFINHNTNKFLSRLIFPIIGSYALDWVILLIQLAFLGHMGKDQLAGAAIGVSMYNVTGSSLIQGILSALDTIASQAFGANQYHKIGLALQLSLVFTTAYTLFIFPLWMVSANDIKFHSMNLIIPTLIIG